MSKASGNTRKTGANITLDDGVKRQIYDYYEKVYNKNLDAYSKQLNDINALSDRQRTILTENVKAYKDDKLRGTDKALAKELNEYQKKYGKIKSLNSALFLRDSIASHARFKAYRAMIPTIEKKLKQ